MSNYKLTKGGAILRLSDNACIPADQANRDYAEYLEWLAKGNIPAPADKAQNPRIAEIAARLAQIDLESVRALRSRATGRGKPADDAKLSVLDEEAEGLRAELAGLPELV